jgi:hypothetical protein
MILGWQLVVEIASGQKIALYFQTKSEMMKFCCEACVTGISSMAGDVYHHYPPLYISTMTGTPLVDKRKEKSNGHSEGGGPLS